MFVPIAALQANAISSKEAARFALSGVYILSGETESLTATDGKRLISVSWSKDIVSEFEGIIDTSDVPSGAGSVIPANVCKEAIRLVKAEKEKIRNPNGLVWIGKNKIVTIKSIISFDPIEGTFPDWQAVIPKVNPEGSSLCMNPDLLSELLDVCGSITGSGGARITLYGKDRPLMVNTKGYLYTVVALAMPLDESAVGTKE
jgi:DNA polymerase III sliding clamp (beta) subunit (PCNA family)